MSAGLEFIVLTGFLGSGKTTLLRTYLDTEAAAETAVIVNEAGEIGLDGAILREGGGEVAMAMLANGCICCEAGSDLAVTVEALLAAHRPDPARPLRRIVLETSGLSKPGPILRQLAPLASHRLRIAVVATYDATRGPDLGRFEEAAAQWAGAHRIVVTKLDAVLPGRAAEAASEAGGVNPLAEIVAEPDPAASAGRALAGPAAFAVSPPASGEDGAASPHPRISTFCLRQSGPIGHDDLAAWLENLAGELGERLLRLKGLVQVEEHARPLLVQSVGTVFSGLRPFGGTPPAEGPFLAVIARDVRAREIEAVTPAISLAMPDRRALGHGRDRRARPPRPMRAEAL